MSSAQKTPFARTVTLATHRRALEEIEKRGYGLPSKVVSADGALVTIAFMVDGVSLPNVTCPLSGSAYVRIPVQPGDMGVAFPAGLHLGQVSGQGTTAADATPRGNLATLEWFPTGNKNWPSVDPNAVTVNGPNGVVLQDTNAKTTSTLTPSGIADSAQDTYTIEAGTSITLKVGSMSIVLDSSGITIAGKDFLTHEHLPGTYVVSSSAVTGISGAVE